MYTVYKHTCPSGKVYIGITCKKVQDRWRNGLGYWKNEYFYKAIKKYGWHNIKHEILFSNLTKEEAEARETELVAKYKSSDKRYGYNLTNGGECAGKHTEETKTKISDALRGVSHAQTEETKEKIRRAHLGVTHTAETKEKMRNAKLGKKASEQTKQKMSDLRKEQFCNRKQVRNIETNEVFNSIREAARKYNICPTGITHACKKTKTAGGYHWEYVS